MSASLASLMPGALLAARPHCQGEVRSVVGLRVSVDGLRAAIGDTVSIRTAAGNLPAEVVALHEGELVCQPLGDMAGISHGDPVIAADEALGIPVGPGLLGRVLDGLGQPIDGGPSLADLPRVGTAGRPPHPLRRHMVDRQIELGVKVLDTVIPCGRGQRLGIFAGSGVGKSSLLSMIARGTSADVSVLALIGERGREVREFLENDLGPEGLARSVVVVATSDEPPMVRLRAAYTATRIAEWWRDQGRDVVLMMDSVTRFCMAQREVGLSAGEPPATRGYPPSVFALLPRLLERAGAGEVGSITGLYTVLVDGDDMNEPIADAARGILDGHVVLSRRLASAGHYPCVEVLDSVSRVAPQILSTAQQGIATELRRLMASYAEAKDLIEIGAYAPGSNPLVDRAAQLRDSIDSFLRQNVRTIVPASESWTQLGEMLGHHEAAA